MSSSSSSTPFDPFVLTTALTCLFAVVYPSRRQSPCRRLNEPLGLVSSVANEEVLDDSWQVTGRGLKSTPTKSAGQEDNEALASDAVLGDIEDGMEKLSIVSLSTKSTEMYLHDFLTC